ncbi:hypothetical protein HY479_02990 [Candidatus Uhrbacteria bacterium]|nr:hypothetical protein [Candidatus Uhrbacteria bacterium]
MKQFFAVLGIVCFIIVILSYGKEAYLVAAISAVLAFGFLFASEYITRLTPKQAGLAAANEVLARKRHDLHTHH